MMPFGQRLKELREKANLSVNEVATKVEIPISTYRDWENGVKILGNELVYVKLANLFEVSLYELLSGEKVSTQVILDEIRACPHLIATC